MSTKIDLEKAYDRLSWSFIEDTLVATEFPPNLRSVIMDCITTASMKFLWNGEETEIFNMGSGIQQVCPLSSGCPDVAGPGGLIRDDNGQWILGFARNIGYGTAAVAELWGVLTGLEQAGTSSTTVSTLKWIRRWFMISHCQC
ncbi:hypothetical protein CRG98_049539 [Punica granatum]|uniref:RNase H type-1 domain-containing protein n=1 Tax=Punica granatum TaxID=22663 RepID=A0A2I0HEW6_PUNGR|nr:hypothetical protein CRG98_049539 [Punica granatum]